MDNETADMEAVTDEMREVMRAWIDDPDNEALKQRYHALLEEYQTRFRDLTSRGVFLGGGATHQAAPGG